MRKRFSRETFIINNSPKRDSVKQCLGARTPNRDQTHFYSVQRSTVEN